MRNIVLSNFESYCIGNLEDCQVFYADENFLLLYDKGKIVKFEHNNGKSVKICDITEFCQTSELEALDLSYSREKNSIFVFLSNGCVYLIQAVTDNTYSSDEVGSFQGGLRAAKWSPCFQFAALVTGNDYVMVMTNDFDTVSEVELHGNDFGVKQFTTVGWGKKETQFRGSEGKYRATSNPQSHEQHTFQSDDSIRISWRGDGEYFAVSYVNPVSSERYLRIFNNEGILQYTSETVPGLEHSLDWRPSGNLIASTQRLPNKYNVCFFEKNGLRYGEFTLPFKQNEAIVQELMWNRDSKLLGLLTERINPSNSQTGSDTAGKNVNSYVREKSLLMYSTSNYHWYCKYRISFDDNSDKVLMRWDQEHSNLLHIVIKQGNSILYTKYNWIWSIQRSKGNSSSDQAFTAVIDGSKLLLTSFKNGILPPPLCTYALEMDSQINQVGFLPPHVDGNTSSNDFFVHLSNGLICLYKYEDDQKNQKEFKHKLIGQLDLKKDFIYNIHWLAHKTFALCEVNFGLISKPFLTIIDIDTLDSNLTYSEKKYVINSPVALLKSLFDEFILLHDNDGNTYSFCRDTRKFNVMNEQKRTLTDMEVIRKKDGSFLVFGLDDRHTFFINDTIVNDNVTSFLIHDEFLLLTSLKNKLFCIPVEMEPSKIIEGNGLNEVSSRRIERGSELVTSIVEGSKVIMQLPRGNLECIQPRALSFSVIAKFLDSCKYFDAFSIMRKQRINLNLLHDHNPDGFKENINLFTEQLKDPSWISLFLSELVDEDVTKTVYSVIYKNTAGRKDSPCTSKIQNICDLLQRTLEKNENADHYVLPILTTYIKRGGTHHIECALKKIKELKECENAGKKLAVSFDEAFRYMLYLIDVEDLYTVALGMYDFELLLLIATKSQKDPKEYLPFLNDLRKLEVNYQKFMIDKHLKRYEKALKHLLHCDGDEFFSECLTFIKTYKLFKAALKLVPRTTDRYKQICAIYADELLTANLHEEAGIMFSKSGSYLNAMEAFKKSGNWQEVISCSTKLQMSAQEMNYLLTNLASELVLGQRFKEASIIHLEYMNNVELGLVTLCCGKLFVEAMRVAEFYRRDDLVQKHIKPGTLECYKTTKMKLNSLDETFQKQRDRLRTVREQKLLEAKKSDRGFESEGDHYSESESSTVITHSYAGSRSTNRTYRSAKNKRKQERKMLSLKEGSPYEDLALIVSLHNVVTRCLEMRSELKELNMCLVKLDEEALAEELQKSLARLLKEIDSSKGEIWTPELLACRQSYGPDATSNSIAASFMQSENVSRTHLINPRLLIPPESQTNLRWQLEILD